jgi:hypothetical protein
MSEMDQSRPKYDVRFTANSGPAADIRDVSNPISGGHKRNTGRTTRCAD